ncbi:MarR family transcriptional regulator [Lysobacter sp. A6]|uniref:MarR family transcriptional regulator n=1 Tax=Noviluteimonas lactosilytica TaxID=2888523 RepID=A0ABS8JJ47_9GAMM|nr:MarR family transcriptional regulator [Lysobacter lactosilyticus]MCC8363617.1 MarR family transcriptional regulator [Lysobacter lactosilyticus]
MRIDVPHPEFDLLFRFYNELWGQLDGALKKQARHPLSLTALQVLTLLFQKPRNSDMTKSRIAEALGVDRSTLSPAIDRLAEKGYVSISRADGIRNQPVKLLPLGRQALLDGLAARSDVLDDFTKVIPSKHRSSFFRFLELANKALAEKHATDRREAYIRTLSKHATKTRARAPAKAYKKPKWQRDFEKSGR